MERRPLLAGNWKMHKTIEESIDLGVRLKYACDEVEDRDVVLCPPYPSLQALAETVGDSIIEVGAQNMHHAEEGAFTGEISPAMVTDTGAEWVILGHSERRRLFGEDADVLREKTRAAAEHGLKVFYCVGETEEQRDRGEAESVIRRQLEDVLDGFRSEQFEELVVAYEPVWAIGTGNTASPEQANDAHGTVRTCLADLFGQEAAASTRVLYGGSVKPHNVAELMEQPQLDGALVGSASLSAADFSAIIHYDVEDEAELPPL